MHNTGLYGLLPLNVYVTSPTDGETLSNADVNVTWAVHNNREISYYEVNIDGIGWTNVGKNTSHKFNDLSNGPNTVEVRAFDLLGKNDTDSVSFTVNVPSPVTPALILFGSMQQQGVPMLYIAMGGAAVAVVVVVGLALWLRRRP